ncbi:MAG: GNAT family N-acetyltransferase [Chloroflexota bacterium]
MTTTAISDLQLLETQIDALFTHDLDGRIRSINEPGGASAPRFFLGRTRTGNVWRFRQDLPEDTVRRLESLVANEPVHDDLRAEPRNLEAFRGVLGEDGGIQPVDVGSAYRFPDELPAPVNVTRIARSNLHLLEGMGPDWEDMTREFEAREPCCAMIEDGAAVSLCFSARLTARAAEAGIETVEAYRGRGYAPKVVAAWANAVRAAGRIPLYSTTWANLALQAVARKLGLIQYGADLSLW